jgi:hypothetical protein
LSLLRRGDRRGLRFVAREQRDGEIVAAGQVSGERRSPRPAPDDEDRVAQSPNTCEMRT